MSTFSYPNTYFLCTKKKLSTFQSLEGSEENSDDDYDFSMNSQVSRIWVVNWLEALPEVPNLWIEKGYKEDRCN